MAVDANGNEIIIQTPPMMEKNPAQERITELSDKVKTTAQERDEALSKAQTAEKERDFYVGFSDVVSTNPAAKDHKDDILAKVKSGYTVEDATYAVLGKAGKLGGMIKAPDPVMPAGGSAVTNPPQGGTKSVSEMTQAERREELSKNMVWS